MTAPLSGPDCYRRAADLVNSVTGRVVPAREAEATIACAQVYATLALAAVSALGHVGMTVADRDAWRAATHPTKQATT